jgi:hypothetical protein
VLQHILGAVDCVISEFENLIPANPHWLPS